MNKKLLDALKSYDCSIQTGKALKAESAAGMDERAVATWWENRLQEHPTGWAQFSDANVWLTDGKPSAQTDGLLLAAEVVAGDVSHHLRPSGDGWTATKLTRVPDPEGIIETCALMNSRERGAALTYEVAWSGTPLRPAAFRLIAPKA
jgi:hypothetical protein